MTSRKNFFEKKTSLYLLLVGLAIFVTGVPTLESFSQADNQSGQEQNQGIGTIEELENLTAPLNTTDQSTGLLGGMEKSQLGEAVPGEQGVNFEGGMLNNQSSQPQAEQGDQSSQPQAEQGDQSSQPQAEQGDQSSQPQAEQGGQSNQSQAEQGNQTQNQSMFEKIGEVLGLK